MEPKKRSRVWRWVGWTLVVLTLAGVVVAGLIAYVVIAGIVQIGNAFSSETEATIRPQVVAERVEFEMGYGKDVTGLAVFVVQDADGNDLWTLRCRGTEKPSKVVYGVVPADPAGAWEQTFPTDGKPADIRGKRVKVEASCRFVVAMGAGHQSTRAEFDIPK